MYSEIYVSIYYISFAGSGDLDVGEYQKFDYKLGMINGFDINSGNNIDKWVSVASIKLSKTNVSSEFQVVVGQKAICR